MTLSPSMKDNNHVVITTSTTSETDSPTTFTIFNFRGNTIMSTYQSRFGYHPCTRETYQKLKEAHLLFLRAIKDIRAYTRWVNKDEPVGEAPKYPSFVADYRWYYRSRKAQKEGRISHGLNLNLGGKPGWGNAKLQFYELLLEQYRNARHPKATAEEVEPLALPDGFWKTVEKLKGFYEVSPTTEKPTDQKCSNLPETVGSDTA